MKNKIKSKNTSEFIVELDKIKSQFGSQFSASKLVLLTQISQKNINGSKNLLLYHESLCYLRAYPDNAKLLKLVEDQLLDFKSRVEYLSQQQGGEIPWQLQESGIVGTSLTHAYGYDMTAWLLANYPESADLDWEQCNELENDPILNTLPVIVNWSENDLVDDPEIGTQEIIEHNLQEGESSLAWFFKNFSKLEASENWKRTIYDSFELPLEINIKDNYFARTRIKLPCKKYYHQKKPLSRIYPNLQKGSIKKSLDIPLLSKTNGQLIIDNIKCAMIMRHRELYPLTFANPEEVYSCYIGHGTTVYVIGTESSMRLPLESNYSAFLVRNGVPIGYGIGAMIFERIEIAINIFDSFRGSEAAFIFGRFAQIYHQLFGSTYLLIRKYQVGDDNEEGLKSGAYWFYYKLGFRSVEESAREIAEQEIKKIRESKKYRTPKSILKRLARSDLFIQVGSNQAIFENSQVDIQLGKVSLLQTKYIKERFGGNRLKATKYCYNKAKKILGIKSLSNWSKIEKLWLQRLAILVCCLPELAEWNHKDKKFLTNLIKAKGSLRERKYINLSRTANKFKKLLFSAISVLQ